MDLDLFAEALAVLPNPYKPMGEKEKKAWECFRTGNDKGVLEAMKMDDKLHQAYEAWKKTVTDPVEFQAFQGGFTAGAVSMRERAMKVTTDVLANDWSGNEALNKIGGLSDIPE